jgi:GDP-4-dehydro-6-deoxy-D-mannose reductase
MSYQIHIVRTRGFNHTGPRRGEVFAESNLARQIAEIEAGLRPPVVYVGNLEAIRDYTDVRDMVRAYWLALEYGTPGEVYNIASGRGYKIRDVLEMLLRMASVDVDVQVDPQRLRPSDVEVLIGDSTRFREITGWTPQIPFEQTLRDLLDYWRERVRAEKDSRHG